MLKWWQNLGPRHFHCRRMAYQGTVIPQFWRPWFWRPSQIGDIIYLVSSWAHLLHTYNLDFGDFDFGDVNFARSQKLPKSRDDCIVILKIKWTKQNIFFRHIFLQKNGIFYLIFRFYFLQSFNNSLFWLFKSEGFNYLSHTFCPRGHFKDPLPP